MKILTIPIRFAIGISLRSTLTILTLLALLTACSPTPFPGKAVVRGTFTGVSDTTLLFSFTPYELLAQSRELPVEVDGGGNFRFEFETEAPVKGYLSFGKVPRTYEFTITQVNGGDTSMIVPSVDFRMLWFWLEPGDSVEVAARVDSLSESFRFTGRGSVNCEFVNREELTFNDYRHKYLRNYYNYTHCSPDQYKEQSNLLRDRQLAFLQEAGSQASLSNHLVRVYLSEYVTGAVSGKIQYPSSHAGFNQGVEPRLPEDYYDFMGEVEIEEEIGTLGIGYFYFLKSLLTRELEISGQPLAEGLDFYDHIKIRLPEETAFQYMALALARDFTSRLYNEFGDDCPYPDIARRVKERYRSMEGMLEGAASPGVRFSTVGGDSLALADLKGSYLYIDFWATWCKPCIAEIPALQEVEKHYHDRNIRFLSVSVDRAGDVEKWKEFVRDYPLSGLQVIAGAGSHELLKKAWNIDLIPRFVLLDPDGRMLKANAPRPSDPRLRVLLDEVLGGGVNE